MTDTGYQSEKNRVLLVTGMSGAGKTLALKTLEDLHFEAVDNVPLPLLSELVRKEALPACRDHYAGLAIGIDSRSRAFSVDGLLKQLVSLGDREDLAIELLFLDCNDVVLHRRYQETRRRHPLSGDNPVQVGIDLERQMLAPLQEIADMVIDTSELYNPDLRQYLDKKFGAMRDAIFTVSVMSFSYRRGLPKEADLVFDARFLRNPHYEDELRDKTGLDEDVGLFIGADPDYEDFIDRLIDLLGWLIPRYRREGKSYLDIAFGCTGGQHRSIFSAKTISNLLSEKGFAVRTTHRDIKNQDS